MFIGCRSKTKSPSTDSISSSVSAKDQSAELIQKFKPIIQGVWVKSDYIDKVIKTKSPLKAMGEASGITTMVFNTDKISGDSLKVGVGWENHEGGELTLKFEQGLFKNSLKVYLGTDTSGGFHEIGLSFDKRDTTLVLYHFNKHNKVIEKISYLKVYNHIGDDLGSAIHYIINKQIIAGTYSTKDSIGIPSPVNFTTEGNISGFLGFKTYYLNIDIN